MEQEVKESVYIGYQLMLCALVLGAIAVCLYIGKGLINSKQRDDIGIQVQQENAEFYSYLNSTVESSDIVDLMLNYAKIYDFVIVSGNSTNVKIEYTKLKNADINEFKATELRKDLEDRNLSGKNFTMRLLLTPDACQILAVVFEKEGANLDNDALQKLAKNTLNIINYDVVIK